MKRDLTFFTLLFIMSSLYSWKSYASSCGTETMYIRGSFNNWKSYAMRCDDKIWKATVIFKQNDEFKFEISGNNIWKENYGDNNPLDYRGNGDPEGANITVSRSGTYNVSFDYLSGKYYELQINEKSFLEYCQKDNADQEIQYTIDTLLLYVNTKDCATANDRLNKLSELSLEWKDIVDISPLSEFKNLRHLVLSHNRIKDIHPLKKLHNLEAIFLNSNHINNIVPITNLYQLKLLDLDDNPLGTSILKSENNCPTHNSATQKVKDWCLIDTIY